VLLGCATLCLVATASAGAPSPPRLTVDIAPQPLNQALAAFGEQTGLQLFYLSETAKTRSSKGARAGLEPSEALAALLEGTGLIFEFVNPRAVRIFPAPNSVPTAVLALPVPPHDPGRHASSGELALEEVIVTARRREEAQSEVPISMAVLSMEDLKNSGVTSIDDLAALVPSLWFSMTSDLGPGAVTYLNMRGVSDRNTSITGVYLDDTPIPAALGYTNFRSFPYTFDLDRIEVLRGPQLQLFGEGNQAGAIRYIYRQPSLQTFTALAQSEVAVPAFGEISYGVGAAVGGPLIHDVLGFRVSAWGRSDGGFVDHVDPFTGATVDKNANHTVNKSLRGALALAVSDAVQIAPSLTYSSYRQHDSQFFFTDFSDVAVGRLLNGNLVRQPYDSSFYVGALRVTARLGALDFSAVSSYFHRSESFLLDFTPVVPTDYGDAVASQYLIQQTTFMQELRVRSADAAASIAWELGAFYSTMHLWDTNNFAGALGEAQTAPLPGTYLSETARTDQTRFAGFGEVSMKLAKGLTLNVGLHGEHVSITTVTEPSPPLPPNPTIAGSDAAILPQLRLSYQPSEHELLYFTAAKGYGTGGTWAVLIQCVPEPPALIGEDTLWSYEAGTKSGLLDGRLQLDASVFHMLWNNSGPGYLTGPDCTTASFLGTAGPATSNGFDFAVHALAGTHVRAGLAVAYADAHYTHTVTQDGAEIVRQGVAVGQLPYTVVAPWNLTASVEYSVPLSAGAVGMLRAEDIFRSRNPGPFQEDDPASPNYLPGNTPDPSTNLLNLRAAFQRPSYDVALFVNNALDSRPTILRRYDGPGGWPPGALATTFRPRTMGLSIGLRY
jgi:outer membrane receptor protein involved in Fe transport